MISPVQTWKLARRFPTSPARWYTRIKLWTDPLYAGARAAMEGASGPLLDVGCGMGLWPFYLRESGWDGAIHGLDYDSRKIEAAQHVARGLGCDITFATGDARQGLPPHSGSVSILDILQYFDAAAQAKLLTEAAARIAPGGRLIVRSGMAARGWRAGVTKAGDLLAVATFWMKAAPQRYPTPEEMDATLRAAGLVGTITPLWGRTPFNNWLAVYERAAA
jgi:SAM-dependent methyltransferase